ncbi:MAG: single-stranded DNA-binding protein [Oscillospiraceae bacterium]|nr:single-stranded DNA-binding protein [Oscillospiraceae bacterium]
MLNITVIGRVAKEPDIRRDANGTPYAIVEVTTHRTYKSADGTHITDTVPVKLYDKQVELFQRFAFPGSRIAIIGNFEPSPFENSDSEYRYLIKARQIEFLSFRKQEEHTEQPEEA